MSEEKTRNYRLVRPFWDGQKLHPQGAILPFPEGKAPRGAKDKTEEEALERQAEARQIAEAEAAAARELEAARKLVAEADAAKAPPKPAAKP